MQSHEEPMPTRSQRSTRHSPPRWRHPEQDLGALAPEAITVSTVTAVDNRPCSGLVWSG